MAGALTECEKETPGVKQERSQSFKQLAADYQEAYLCLIDQSTNIPLDFMQHSMTEKFCKAARQSIATHIASLASVRSEEDPLEDSTQQEVEYIHAGRVKKKYNDLFKGTERSPPKEDSPSRILSGLQQH